MYNNLFKMSPSPLKGVLKLLQKSYPEKKRLMSAENSALRGTARRGQCWAVFGFCSLGEAVGKVP